MKHNIIYNGDTLEVLKTFPDASIDCVVTSPPYWGLRDYGIEGQLGLEPTFQEYLEKLWVMFDEVYRVLKPAGTCWVNLGDTYNTTPIGYVGNKAKVGATRNKNVQEKASKQRIIQKTVKIKSLCLIPQRFAIGMVDRGWILRNDIIWHKPNAMPSSVKDRFTVDYEHIFFFVKQKKYYFEQIFEKFSDNTIKRIEYPFNVSKGDIQSAVKHTGANKYAENVKKGNLNGRNKRTVWSIATKPFKDAHFAVFPPEIPEICIKAGCPKDGIVLDPFAGSGTTNVVAKKLGRDWVGIELNQEYIEMAYKRINAVLV